MASRSLLPAIVLAAIAGACAPVFAQDSDASRAGSLFERLGGAATVSAFVGETIDRAAIDPQTKHSFERLDLQHVKAAFVAQICALTGGDDCEHSPDTMRAAHATPEITDALRASMRRQNVPLAARNELLEILAR